MPGLSVAFDAETLEELEAERRLLGFESRGAYVRWLVDRRDALEDARPRADGLEIESEDQDSTATNPDGTSGATETDGFDDAPGSLTPERVTRVSEDDVGADATVLETVRFDRLDELSRRAVAETRSRLDREVETGLEYRSTASLGRESLRSGADLVDLDALSVPGRSADRRERRRAVAGRAIAFLRDEGRARKATVVGELYDSYPVGYETADGWWTFLKDVFEQVDAVEGGAGSRVWRYVGNTRRRDA
ncbi:hypothetical protein [Natronococcus roseus]|uniref:hypothetical protein n=1 Tax=Natronococcus roseus TaxID=1052014 RepID=UPI00374CC646